MLSTISDVQARLPSTSVYKMLNKYTGPKALGKAVIFNKPKKIKFSKTPKERQTSVVMTNTREIMNKETAANTSMNKGNFI
jgi:hypothetical protein